MRITDSAQPMPPAEGSKPPDAQATVALQDITSSADELTLTAHLHLSLPRPAQDAQLLTQLEKAIAAVGQQIKRQLFRYVLEYADREVVLAQRAGKDGQGIQRRGTAPLTCKTVFGTAVVRRQRVTPKADGSAAVRSAHLWQTPQQVLLTQGLRDAVCDGLLEQSTTGTLERLQERAGEVGLIARRTVLNIVHEEGNALRAEMAARAARVWDADPWAAQTLLPTAAEPTAAEAVAADPPNPPPVEQPAAAGAGGPPLGFPGSPAPAPAVAEAQPRRVEPDWVVVEAAEDKVKAQACTGAKEIWVYTAVVLTAWRTWYFTAACAADLRHQVGALLAALGVHRGRRSLLFLADGARWIRSWLEGLGVASKAMILCW